MSERISWRDCKDCFYTPGQPGIIDLVHPNTGKSVISGDTLEEIRERYPDAEIGDFDEIVGQQDAYWRKPPTEITQERFIEMLEVLPPVGWEIGEDTEVFKLCERTSGTMTAIFCRLGDRYFELCDNINMPAGMVIAKCEAL